MYSAEQIRNKAYIPDPCEGVYDDDDISLMIMIADASSKRLIRVKQNMTSFGIPKKLIYNGYNVESVEFLGTKFWQISW